MKADRLLTEMFVSEATLEVPDSEMAPLKRVFAGAIRSRRLPQTATDWLVDRGPKARRAADRAKPASNASKPAPPADIGPSARTGRAIPATNRFRQQSDDEPDAPHGEMPSGNDSSDSDTAHGSHTGARPSALTRAWAALRGKDPETGLRKPPSAQARVYGKAGPATNLPRFDRIPDSDTEEGPYRSPFQGLGIPSDDSDDEDPFVGHLAQSLGKAKAKANEPAAKDDFEDDERTDVDARPAPKAKPKAVTKAKRESRALLQQMFAERNDRRD